VGIWIWVFRSWNFLWSCASEKRPC
jgi:hypothetical protein